MKKYLNFLQNISLFHNIDEKNLENILSCLEAKVVSYSRNETIISEGSNAKYIYIVLSGSVQLERTDYYGNRSIIATVNSCEMFGEAFACAEIEQLPLSAVAIQKSEIMLIECNKIIHICNNGCEFHNQLIYNLLKVVANKNIILNQKAEIISKRTTREKLMSYLMFQAKKNKNNSFTIPYDRQTLADFLEVDRSGLSNEISKLRNEGVLESHKNIFKLL